MESLETINVSSRGQIVIPERLRVKMKIKQGSKLVMLQDGGRIIMQTEESFLSCLRAAEEKKGWREISQKSLAKAWSNKKDDEAWKKY